MARIETPKPLRGVQDIFGEQQLRFARVLEAFDHVRRLHAFQRVDMPVIESTAVFSRALGETTDVVSKEMYTFEDKSDRSITLRPEFTAGICRAYLTEGWQQYAPLKLVTSGPVFRYEAPQAGRYRQFHQVDAEIIGVGEAVADVELLSFADQLLHELGVADGVTLQLNTLGDAETREVWRAALVAHFQKHRGELSEESLVRLDKNPMRILDSKDPRDRPIAEAAPDIDAFLTSEAGAFFEAVQKGLQVAGVKSKRDARLVRGLDYYRHTAFEFVTDRLGAQGTVLAGGRYDGLIEALGGPATPGVGWAAGVERLAMLLEEVQPAGIDFIVFTEEDDMVEEVMEVTNGLRRQGHSADFVVTGSPRKRYDKSQQRKPKIVLLVKHANDRGQSFYVDVKRGRGAAEVSAQEAKSKALAALSFYPLVELSNASNVDIIVYQRQP